MICVSALIVDLWMNCITFGVYLLTAGLSLCLFLLVLLLLGRLGFVYLFDIWVLVL